MQIVQITSPSHAEEFAHLVQLLWPHCSKAEATEASYQTILHGGMFVAKMHNEPIGFAHAMLRHDYVEGTSSSPVGYLEGIFVKAEFRQQGIASQLLQACENWAKSKGCTELASDAELTNTQSQAFHLSIGFKKANTIVCFTKSI